MLDKSTPVEEGIAPNTFLEPLGDRIIARQFDASDTTKGGLILPEQAKKKPKEAMVLSVGPGRRTEGGELIPMQVEVGDHVIFAAHAGQPLNVDGGELILLSSEDILAKVKKIS